MALGFLTLAVFFWQRKRMLAGRDPGWIADHVRDIIRVRSGGPAGGLGSDPFCLRYPDRNLKSIPQERNLLLAGIGIALVAVGTLFALEFQGLAATVQALAIILPAGLAESDGQHPLAILLGLIVYQPMGLLFAILLWLNRNKNGEIVNILLTIVFLVFLALTLVYPARGMWMLIWAVVPLWLLAGQVDRRVSLCAG